jgi:hypothetical protein
MSTMPLIQGTDAGAANGQPLSTSQRALAGARLVRQLASDARTRQRAGTRAPDGAKGKSAAKAAAQFGVSTRAVELALTVLNQGVRELMQAVQDGKISVSTAAKVPTQPADAQRQVVAEIAAGRPVVEALAAAGVQEREPLRFDGKTLTQAMAHVRKLLDLRARAFGPNNAYRQAREQLDLANRAISRWRTERLNEPVPVIVDDCGRRVPLKVVSAFQTVEEIKILCGQLDAIGRQVEGLARTPGGKLIQAQCVVPELIKARKVLWNAQPATVCHWCSGNSPTCSQCYGRGWLPVSGWTPEKT